MSFDFLVMDPMEVKTQDLISEFDLFIKVLNRSIYLTHWNWNFDIIPWSITADHYSDSYKHSINCDIQICMHAC